MSADVTIANELEAGRWLKATVQGATGLSAYLDLIPEDQDLPAIRYQVQRRSTTQTAAAHVAISTFYFLVVATLRGERLVSDSGFSLPATAQQIIEGLHKTAGETDLAIVNSCTFEESYGMTEGNGPDVFRHAGGIFKVLAQGKPAA